MSIHPKQSPRLVRKQLETARKDLATKRAKLDQTVSKPHQSRLKLEIRALQQRISEYEAWLRAKGH